MAKYAERRAHDKEGFRQYALSEEERGGGDASIACASPRCKPCQIAGAIATRSTGVLGVHPIIWPVLRINLRNKAHAGGARSESPNPAGDRTSSDDSNIRQANASKTQQRHLWKGMTDESQG